MNSNLWFFAIHGECEEIIHILEELNIHPPNYSNDICIKESIKCHHNNMVEYFLNNSENDEKDIFNVERNYDNNIISYCFHYYNFAYLPDDLDEKYMFYYACEYDYFLIVQEILKSKDIDINETIISIKFFLSNSKIIFF